MLFACWVSKTKITITTLRLVLRGFGLRFVCLSRVCPGSPRCLFTGVTFTGNKLESLRIRV